MCVYVFVMCAFVNIILRNKAQRNIACLNLS